MRHSHKIRQLSTLLTSSYVAKNLKLIYYSQHSVKVMIEDLKEAIVFMGYDDDFVFEGLTVVNIETNSIIEVIGKKKTIQEKLVEQVMEEYSWN